MLGHIEIVSEVAETIVRALCIETAGIVSKASVATETLGNMPGFSTSDNTYREKDVYVPQ